MISKKQSIKCINTCVASALAAFAMMAPQAALAAPLYSADTLIGSDTPDNSGKAELALFLEAAGNTTLTPTKIDTNVKAYADGDQWYIDVGTSTPGYFMLKFGNGSTPYDSHYFFKNDGKDGANKLVWTNAQVNFLTGGNCLGASVTPPATTKPGKSGKTAKVKETAPDESSCNIGRLSHFAFAGMFITPPVDNPPVDNPPVDNPPVDNPPGDNPPTDVPPTDIPEPGSLALAGLGLLALFGARKKLAK